MSLGAEKLTTLAGGIVGAIGTLLPFYLIPDLSLSGPSDDSTAPSMSMVGHGGIGWLVLLLAVALGALPLVSKVTRVLAIAGFGLSIGVLGILLGDRTSMIFSQAVLSIDFGAGFYFVAVGFIVLAYAYGRRAHEA